MESDPLSQVVAVYVSWNTAEELADRCVRCWPTVTTSRS